MLGKIDMVTHAIALTPMKKKLRSYIQHLEWPRPKRRLSNAYMS